MYKIQALVFLLFTSMSIFAAASELKTAASEPKIAMSEPKIAISEPKIEGEWVQGGLLRGQVAEGSIVEILGLKPYIDAKGHFIFGLGRDTKSPVTITVTAPDGKTRSYDYPVKQRKYETQRIEGVAQKYVEPPPEVTKRIKDEAGMVWRARQKTANQAFFSEGFSWPLIGPITGVYGSQRIFNGVPKRPHYGLDIAGPTGKIVVAPAPGVVRLAHDDMYYSGGTLIVDHGQGLSSTFIHLSEILVSEGQEVKTGDAIAKVGATGRVTGPHLDWRINWFSQRLDPLPLLPPMPSEDSKPAQ